MVYLTKEDLISSTFERFIDESTEDQEETLGLVEGENIELIKSYLGTRYNVNQIFSVSAPIRNTILVRILKSLVMLDVVSRNAARKVPSDYEAKYNKAIELLEKLATGRLKIKGLPGPVDDNGGPIQSNSLWGNNTNKNFYI